MIEKLNSIIKPTGEQLDKLDEFCRSLIKWNKSINLISKSSATENEIWQRHIIDSAQLVQYINSDTKTITDLGSGGGFPGIILSILTDAKVAMVESDQRKAAFLTQISAQLELNTKIYNERIEAVGTWNSDILTARAFASLNDIFEIAYDLVDKSKISIFLKGETIVEEIREAKKKFQFDYQLKDSITDNKAKIVLISSLVRR